MVKKTIYSFDLGSNFWRIAHSLYEISGDRSAQFLTLPVPVVLSNFNHSQGGLPVAFKLNTDGKLLTYGEKAYQELQEPQHFNNWYETPQVGDFSPLFIELILPEVIQQLHQERPNNSDDCIYLFSYPNSWNDNLIRDFQQIIYRCLPQQNIDFVPQSQGLLLGVLHHKLVIDEEGKNTLIIDFGDSTIDFVYGANLTQKYQELDFISFPNLDFFYTELINFLADKLSISVTKKDYIWYKLKQYARQIKENFSRVTDPDHLVNMNLIFAVNDDQIINQEIRLTLREFEEIITPSLTMIKQILEQFFQNHLSPDKIRQIFVTGGGGNYHFLNKIFRDIPEQISIIFCKNPERNLVTGLALWYGKNGLYPFKSEIISSNYQQAENYHQQAITKIKQENYLSAIDDLNQAIALNPEYRSAYFNRSQVRYQLGDYQGSIQDLEVTINMNPQDYYAYYRMGSSLLQDGNYEQAISNYNRSLQYNPNLAEAYFEKGVCEYYLGDMHRADRDINQALSISPKLVEMELNQLKKQKGLFGLGRNQKVMNELIKFLECLLEKIGIKKSGFNPLETVITAIENITHFIPIDPETIDVLTYKDVIGYFVTEKPSIKNIKGALLKQKHRKGYLMTQVFIDVNNDLVCRNDDSPYGRKLVAKSLDRELSEQFGNTSLLIAE
jgi:tetratricopeptide (TPR) repeat protein